MSQLDPHIDMFLKMMAAQPQPPIDELPLAEVRNGYRLLALADIEKPGMAEVRDLKVDGAEGPLAARLYEPKGAPTPSAGLVFFHGGGFVIGDLDTHDPVCRYLADHARVRVLSVDYRLAPEHVFPAGHEDALASTLWAFRHAREIGFDPKRIAVGGDSAGGNLAASVALSLKDNPEAKLAYQLLLYPVVDYQEERESRRLFDQGYFLTRQGMEFFQKSLFAGAAAPVDPRLSVIRAGDFRSLAPALIATAGFDPLRDEGAEYARVLQAAGVEVAYVEHPSLIHAFYQMGHISPAAKSALQRTAEKLGEALGTLQPA